MAEEIGKRDKAKSTKECSRVNCGRGKHRARTKRMLKVSILASKSRMKGYYSNLNNKLQLQKEGA